MANTGIDQRSIIEAGVYLYGPRSFQQHQRHKHVTHTDISNTHTLWYRIGDAGISNCSTLVGLSTIEGSIHLMPTLRQHLVRQYSTSVRQFTRLLVYCRRESSPVWGVLQADSSICSIIGCFCSDEQASTLNRSSQNMNARWFFDSNWSAIRPMTNNLFSSTLTSPRAITIL